MSVVSVCMCSYIGVELVEGDLFTSEHLSFEHLFPAAITWRQCVSG